MQEFNIQNGSSTFDYYVSVFTVFTNQPSLERDNDQDRFKLRKDDIVVIDRSITNSEETVDEMR